MADPVPLKLVEQKQTASENILQLLKEIQERAGEFQSMYFVGVRADGSWLTQEAGGEYVDGTDLHVLTKIGVLENIKFDLIHTSSTRPKE